MKDIINSVGTIITIVALVMAMFLGNLLLSILAVIGVVYVIYFHDENLKYMWEIAKSEQWEREYNEMVARYEKALEGAKQDKGVIDKDMPFGGAHKEEEKA
jgi:hypothetical protein